MDVHKNARLTPLGRERMIEMILNAQTLARAAALAGVCARTAKK